MTCAQVCLFVFFPPIQYVLVKLTFVCNYLPSTENWLGKKPAHLSVEKRNWFPVAEANFTSVNSVQSILQLVKMCSCSKQKRKSRGHFFRLSSRSRRTPTSYTPFPAVFILNHLNKTPEHIKYYN